MSCQFIKLNSYYLF